MGKLASFYQSEEELFSQGASEHMKMGCKHSLPTDNTKTRNTLVCTSAAWFI
jgi:hypothetical protein